MTTPTIGSKVRVTSTSGASATGTLLELTERNIVIETQPTYEEVFRRAVSTIAPVAPRQPLE